MVTFLAAVVSLVLSSAFATATPSASTPLLRRQSSPDITPSEVPSACVNVCQPLQVFAGTCGEASCFCTASIASAYDDCLSCALKQNIAGFTQADVDAAVKAYTDACADAGFTVDTSGDSGNSGANTQSANPVKSSGTGTGASAASTSTPANDPSKSTAVGLISAPVTLIGPILIAAVAGLAIL